MLTEMSNTSINRIKISIPNHGIERIQIRKNIYVTFRHPQDKILVPPLYTSQILHSTISHGQVYINKIIPQRCYENGKKNTHTLKIK